MAAHASNLLKADPPRRSHKTDRRRVPSLWRLAAIFLLLVIVAGIGGLGLATQTAPGRIAYGVKILDVDVGGLTPEAANEAVTKRLASYVLPFRLGGDGVTLLAPFMPDGDASPIADFNVATAVNAAYRVGRDAEPIPAARSRLMTYLFGAEVSTSPTFDRAELERRLEAAFGGLNQPPRDAALVVTRDPDSDAFTAAVTSEQDGLAPDWRRIEEAVGERLAALDVTAIAVRVTVAEPRLRAADVEPLAGSAVAALERTPLALRAKTLSWIASGKLVADWLTALPTGDDRARARLAIDPEKFAAYLESRTVKLRVEPTDAVFTVSADGRVADFEPSQDGEAPDLEAALVLIEDRLFGPNVDASEIDLPFKVVLPKISTAASNPWGIQEILGVGESNFKGSPKNRISNIKNGARSLDGVIIPADEEFSLLKALGPIDDAHGYLKELVIKKDKTTPEFGGGLCQIGTTTFRAALAAGLPISERRNHSYRVSYYEKDGAGKYIGPGKDATIYDPWPDLKFKNDTGHALMLTTRIEGYRVTFTFWGVKDGRTAAQTDSRVWNEVPPPEKKIVETTDLPPGQTKCTETPHPGADAMFTYTVTYANGRVEKQDFYSHYRPWGEVCLIGVTPETLAAHGSPLDAAAGATGGAQMPSADAAGASGQ